MKHIITKKSLIIFFNLFFIILILVYTEKFYSNKWRIYNINDYKSRIINTIPVDEYFTLLIQNNEVNGAFSPSFRKDVNITSKRKPILFMGCSFTYGDGLEEDETVSAKLGKLTDRPVYNRAGKGWGLAQFLYLLRRNDFYISFDKEPEYLIYIYISDHINRLDKYKIEPNTIDMQPKYKNIKGHLIETKPHFYDKFAIVQDFQYFYNYRFNKKNENTALLYFKESINELQKHWGNIKPVILLYPIFKNQQFDEEFIKNLEDIGYIVIDLNKLTENKIDFSTDENRCDGWHPAAHIWDILLPKLIEKLDL